MKFRWNTARLICSHSSGKVSTEPIWPIKPEIVTIWSFTEKKKCQPLQEKVGARQYEVARDLTRYGVMVAVLILSVTNTHFGRRFPENLQMKCKCPPGNWQSLESWRPLLASVPLEFSFGSALWSCASGQAERRAGWAEAQVSAGLKAPELFLPSPAAGRHHGRFLCPDAGGILWPHWVSHALHRPPDHHSDHHLGGPASL